MTREEFMEHARKEVDSILASQKNRMMNLIAQAWAEGKRNAEIDGISEIVKEAIENTEKNRPWPTLDGPITVPIRTNPLPIWYNTPDVVPNKPIITCTSKQEDDGK